MKTISDGLRQLAVNKVFDAKAIKAARADLQAGDFDIDITVRIRGKVTVGEAFEQAFPVAVPWEALAKIMFDKLNAATQRSVLAEVTAAWNDGDLDVLKEDVDDRVSDETWAVFQGMKDRTVRAVNGKVTPKLVAEFV